MIIHFISRTVAGSQTVNSTEASANLNTSGWLIPTGGPRWSWTVDDLKKWYGDAAEIISEDESKTIVALGLDMLAAGIGNIHGKYPANWPGLSFETLAAVKDKISDMPDCS